MKSRVILAYGFSFICLFMLAGSYFQWKGKLDSVKGLTAPVLAATGGETSKSPEPEVVEEEDEPVVESRIEMEQLVQLTSNQGESVRTVFANRLESGERLAFLIVGSEAMNEGHPGYAEQLKVGLSEAYGEDFVDISAVSFKGTSAEFVAKLDEGLIDFTDGYDVILFEPFTLNNNGKVVIEDEHQHLMAFRERLRTAVKDAVVVLHPPHPIHRANYYLVQVGALEKFAKLNGIPYVNHWTAWPDKDSDALLGLLDDKGMPNATGAGVWADVLRSYFVGE